MRRWLAALPLLLAQPALAHDAADENWASRIDGARIIRGHMQLVYAGVLCSNLAAADTNTGGNTTGCTPLDFGLAGTTSRGIGDMVVLHLYNDGQGLTCTSGVCTAQSGGTNSCATAVATFSTAPILGTGNAPPTSARAIAQTTAISDDGRTERALTLNIRDTPLSRYLFTEFAGAACDDVDVTIEIYELVR